MAKRRATRRQVVEEDDLLALDKKTLAGLVARHVGGLPYHRQKEWASRHLPSMPARASSERPRAVALLREIEAFCATSRAGAYVSWTDDGGWYDSDDEGDGEEFDAWTALFTDLMKGALELTQGGRHAEAVEAYRKLLGLLHDAGETTDILGNHGAPEESIRVDLPKVIGSYARSLLASNAAGGVAEALTELLPVAKSYRYAGGYLGLARALDAAGREQLRAQLTRLITAVPTTGRPHTPAPVEGLIALARVERKPARVLALKEQYAARNAIYLKDVLAHYQKRKDWDGVSRMAALGMEHFGRSPELTQALLRARDALGDRAAARDAHVAHFLAASSAREFKKLRQRFDSAGDWPAVFDGLLQATRQPGGWSARGLTLRLLLAEGREREVVDGLAARRGTDIDELKLLAKYAVARLTGGMDLTKFKKLRPLQTRLTRDRDDPYDWLRLGLERPATLERSEHARLACRMYRGLVDLHLTSGKSSRAAPAAHYCVIVAELSRLLEEPGLWSDLLAYLQRAHGKKRLIWEHLRAQGYPVE